MGLLLIRGKHGVHDMAADGVLLESEKSVGRDIEAGFLRLDSRDDCALPQPTLDHGNYVFVG